VEQTKACQEEETSGWKDAQNTGLEHYSEVESPATIGIGDRPKLAIVACTHGGSGTRPRKGEMQGRCERMRLWGLVRIRKLL
jgi:hypothetical protein